MVTVPLIQEIWIRHVEKGSGLLVDAAVSVRRVKVEKVGERKGKSNRNVCGGWMVEYILRSGLQALRVAGWIMEHWLCRGILLAVCPSLP